MESDVAAQEIASGADASTMMPQSSLIHHYTALIGAPSPPRATTDDPHATATDSDVAQNSVGSRTCESLRRSMMLGDQQTVLQSREWPPQPGPRTTPVYPPVTPRRTATDGDTSRPVYDFGHVISNIHQEDGAAAAGRQGKPDEVLTDLGTAACKDRRPVSVTMRNYKKDETPILNTVRVIPAGTSAFLCVSDIADATGKLDELDRVSAVMAADVVRTTAHAAVLIGGADGKTVLDVNEPWLKTCGFTREELIGNSMALIQGAETFHGTSGAEVKRLMDACKDRRPVSVTMRNYKKDKTPILNTVRVIPAGTSSFLCVSDIANNSMLAASSDLQFGLSTAAHSGNGRVGDVSSGQRMKAETVHPLGDCGDAVRGSKRQCLMLAETGTLASIV